MNTPNPWLASSSPVPPKTHLPALALVAAAWLIGGVAWAQARAMGPPQVAPAPARPAGSASPAATPAMSAAPGASVEPETSPPGPPPNPYPQRPSLWPGSSDSGPATSRATAGSPHVHRHFNGTTGAAYPRVATVDSTASSELPHIEVHADLQNLLLFRNDSDLDRTKPVYGKYGQSVGALATLLRPKITWHVHKNLRLYYEAELGLNLWSRNNPDQQSPVASDAFVLKHREVYSEGEFLQGRIGFKAGYQYFRDTTGLFVGHWMGAASSFFAWNDSSRASLFFGQIPDATYEGIKVSGDPQVVNSSFRRDIFVFGPRTDLKLGERASFAAAVHMLYDSHLVDKTLWVVAPNMQFEGRSGAYSGLIGGVLQVGRFANGALGGKDQNLLAWAAQAHGEAKWDPAELALNVLALSPDDQAEGNTRNGAFLYSSKSRSATIILTEDELRNWYDQLDRRMGSYEGGFWRHRAGLFIGDVKGTWVVTKVFRPALIVGAASVLNKKNAMDKSFVGVETDVNLEFRASEHLAAHLVGGVLLAGGAGGALLNKINLQATDPIWSIVGSLMARY